MRHCLLAATLLLVLACPAARADPAYAPPSRPGPPLHVPHAQLAAAMQCSRGIDHPSRAPVLLVPGTGASADDNYSWNYEPALNARGIPWCAVTFPFNGNGDIQVNGEYMVYAIRTLHARAGRPIAIIGHSQGGMVPRWALRFWPDTRPMVDDLIGFAPSNHGTTQAGLTCGGSCIIADWQQAYMSNFIRALNSFQETFPGISYTDVYTHNDEIVRPNSDDTGSSSLHGGGGRITNVAVQDICPADSSDHDLLGTVDAVAYALASDALDHDGPAVPGRVPVTVCAQPYMPGINPVTGPAAGLKALYDDETSTGPETTHEPPLACYVFASCPLILLLVAPLGGQLHGHAGAALPPARGPRRADRQGRRLRGRPAARVAPRPPIAHAQARAAESRQLRDRGRHARFRRGASRDSPPRARLQGRRRADPSAAPVTSAP